MMEHCFGAEIFVCCTLNSVSDSNTSPFLSTYSSVQASPPFQSGSKLNSLRENDRVVDRGYSLNQMRESEKLVGLFGLRNGVTPLIFFNFV